jgi:hypothetical protein
MDPIYLKTPTATPPPPSPRRRSYSINSRNEDSDNEDQLDDSDAPDASDPAPQSANRGEELEDDDDEPEGGPRRRWTRTSGQTLLPHTRLENILRADGAWPSSPPYLSSSYADGIHIPPLLCWGAVGGTGGSGPMSKEALFVLSVATVRCCSPLASSTLTNCCYPPFTTGIAIVQSASLCAGGVHQTPRSGRPPAR